MEDLFHLDPKTKQRLFHIACQVSFKEPPQFLTARSRLRQRLRLLDSQRKKRERSVRVESIVRHKIFYCV